MPTFKEDPKFFDPEAARNELCSRTYSDYVEALIAANEYRTAANEAGYRGRFNIRVKGNSILPC